MGDYAFRVMSAMLRSELLPARMRTKVMRAAGFDLSPDICIWPGGLFRSRRISVGPGVFINVGFYHDGYDMLRIGANVRIGPFVRVITATHEIGPSTQRGSIAVVSKPVEIAAGSWIGSGAIILPGVTIARGCVIAANSVVLRSTEPDGLYAGSPAKRVRDLSP